MRLIASIRARSIATFWRRGRARSRGSSWSADLAPSFFVRTMEPRLLLAADVVEATGLQELGATAYFAADSSMTTRSVSQEGTDSAGRTQSIGPTAADEQAGSSQVSPADTDVRGPQIAIRATTTDEGGVVTLTGNVANLEIQDTGPLELVIDWGEGRPETVAFPAEGSQFTVTHRYLDDSPTGTSQDDYLISVTLRRSGDIPEILSVATTTTTVRNVAPSFENNLVLNPTTPQLGQPFTLTGSFLDPGQQDKFDLVVDWGDGTDPETQFRSTGQRDIALTHTYATSSGPEGFLVQLVLRDDDIGETRTTFRLVVNPDPPQILNLAATTTDEGGIVTLTGNVSNLEQQGPGPLELVIDWGEGRPETVAFPVEGSQFTATHRYLDDSPTGTSQDDYPISVTLRRSGDIPENLSVATTTTTVRNVAPSFSNVQAIGLTAAPNGTVQLTGQFHDVGSRDKFELSVNWGDGTQQTLFFAFLGQTSGTFDVSHQYESGSNLATRIEVVIVDDDTGRATIAFETFVFFPEMDIPPPVFASLATGGTTIVIIPEIPTAQVDNNATLVSSENSEFRTSRGQSLAIEDEKFELREVSPLDHSEIGQYALRKKKPAELLRQLTELPDGHYRVYLLHPDGTQRIVLDVHVRQHRVIDPGDDSDGAREQPADSGHLEESRPSAPPEDIDAGASRRAPTDDATRTGATDDRRIRSQPLLEELSRHALNKAARLSRRLHISSPCNQGITS